MSRLSTPSIDAATGTTRELFDSLHQGLGRVPNMAAVMGNSPAVLEAWVQFNGSLQRAALPAGIRERIALLSAEINECSYCLSAHTALGKAAGLDAAQIEAARDGEASDPKALAALTFARRVIETRGGIEASDVDLVRSAGFSDGEIAEIVGVVALNQFTNIFNRAFDIEIDFPRVDPRGCPVG